MKEKISIWAIFANIVLAISKITIGFFSHSSAVLAGGIDSFVDIFASVISYLGIKFSSKPADEEHPYGHYKIEVLSGIIITILILSAGVGILYDAYQNFLNPQEVIVNYLTIGVMVFSVTVNALMSKLKIDYGKKENSLGLLSDGIHSRIDVYTSLAILVGLFFTKYWIYSDAVLAVIMGMYIIREAFSIGKEAMDSLLDISAGKDKESKIRLIAKSQNIDINSLKTQKKGSVITANLEIKLPNNLTVEEATKTSDRLREELMEKIENLKYIAIQIVSHETETSFYQPGFGKGFGWQRKGKFKDKVKEAEGKGVGGNCICEKCGYKTPHKKGVPCGNIKCPSCGTSLKRE